MRYPAENVWAKIGTRGKKKKKAGKRGVCRDKKPGRIPIGWELKVQVDWRLTLKRESANESRRWGPHDTKKIPSRIKIRASERKEEEGSVKEENNRS